MPAKKILIIDDEEQFCLYIKRGLESGNLLRVSIATSGKEGIEKAKELKPDLILLDISMPGMDGLDTLQSLKFDMKTSNIPVMMLTVINDDRSRIKAANLYIEKYFTKPIRIDKIETIIRDFFTAQHKDEHETD